ncbi:restriction endonuclease subunit S [Glutamicibacter sp. TV12E]|uniref:restriction endonuclease subunit S n=1 Tax=Glutamicibacter sp. TV12E TaxID=3446362 RepID=UPI004034F0CF
MSMKPYPAYKDSGVMWLGDVPEHWNISPLGQHFMLRNTNVSDKDFQPLSVTMSGVLPQMEHVTKTENGESRKLVLSGDFVINSRSDRKGSSGIADRDGSVSQISIVLEPLDVEPRFVHHLLRSVPFQEEFYRFGTGIVADLWSTRFSSMKTIRLAVPPTSEQKCIVAYLDRELDEIDAFIADQEELIELLSERRTATITSAVTKGLDPNAPLKNSGVEWLGKVPEHWSIGLCKNTSMITLGKMLQPARKSTDDTYAPYLRAANVQPQGRLDLQSTKSMWFTNSELSRLDLRAGDTVIVEGGVGGFGRAAFIDRDLIGWGFQNSIVRLRPYKGFSSKFLTFAFLHLREAGYISMAASVTSMPHFTAEKVAATVLVWPREAEQAEIAAYLDRETAAIDAAIADAREAIALSKERRAAVISAAVTGKIDVRGLIDPATSIVEGAPVGAA